MTNLDQTNPAQNDDCLFTVPAGSLTYLDQKLAGLNKKAEKLGCKPVTYKVLRTWTEKCEELRTVQGVEKMVVVTYVYADIEVFGEAPRVGDYSLLAIIEPGSEAGNLIRQVPSAEVKAGTLVPYRAVDPTYCGHCKLSRQRKETFLAHHNETGEIVQVGRTCLREFLGTDTPEKAVAQAMAMFAPLELFRGVSETEPGSGSWSRALDMEDYLVGVYACIRKDGYLSGSKAYNTGRSSTAENAWDLCSPPRRPSNEWLRWADERRPQEGDRELVQAIIAEARATLDAKNGHLNDFEHNLLVHIQRGWITTKGRGFAAYIIPFVQKLRERKLDSATKYSGEFFSEVGKRDDVQVEVTGKKSLDFSTLYTLRTLDGSHKLKWFCSSTLDMQIGDRHWIKGTVKAHQDHETYGRSTLINRVVDGKSPEERKAEKAEKRRIARERRAAKKAAAQTQTTLSVARC